MERNFADEIDALQAQMAQMNESLQTMLRQLAPQLPPCATGGPNPTVGHVEKMVGMHPVPEVSAILDKLEDSCGENGNTGRISYMGVFASGGRQSTWARHDVSTDDLLNLVENRTAERLLACVGSNDRLQILLALLRRPHTVAALVSDCGFSSNGQVYHHLGSLVGDGLVTQDKRGVYVIKPQRVPGLIMLLAGIADLADRTCTPGTTD